MGKLLRIAYNESKKDTLQEVLAFLEQIENLDEKKEAWEGQRTELSELINEKMRETEQELKDVFIWGVGEPWDFDQYRNEKIFCEDEVLTLEPVTKENKFLYREIRGFYSPSEQDKDTDIEFPEELAYLDEWGERTIFRVLMRRKEDDRVIGYCDVEKTNLDLWEVAIELRPEYCHQGYGTQGLKLFLNKISELTGKQQFRVLVEADNYPSQSFMKNRMAAEFIGLVANPYLNEEKAISFAQRHQDLIDEQMIAAACELGITPSEMLSHLLEYRIDLTKTMA